MINKSHFLLFLVIISSIILNCQSYESFWKKYKYSIKVIYLEDKHVLEFYRVSENNKGNRVFGYNIFYEILEKCDVKSRENISRRLPPNKLLYKRLVRDTEKNKPVCTNGYKKEKRIFFIRLDKDFDEDDEIGFVPYICFIRLPPFKLPKGVGFFEYLKKNEYIKAYIYKRETFFEKKKEYKFKMDENGVIWVFYRD